MKKMKFCIIGLLFLSTMLNAATDMLNRDVEIKDSKRLVFIGPGALRFGVYMGLEDRVVGIENIEFKGKKMTPYRKNSRKEFSKLPIIGAGGPGKMPSVEALIEAKPDLIIASFVDKEQANLITKKTKIPVFVVSYGSGYGGKDIEKIKTIKQSLKLIGQITNTKKRADKLISWMDKQEKEFSKISFDRSKTIYIGGVGFKGSWGITSSESDYLPLSLLGLENVLKDKKAGHIFLDLEKIISVNPDIILLDKGGKVKIKEEMKSKKPIFDKLKAFKNKQNYWVEPFNFYNTNIENCYLVAWQVAGILGAKIDMSKKKKEIFDIFFK